MTKCGIVAVIGAPNAGKSTLVNALVGSKVAIVSPKVQTTRARLIGIAMADDTQLLLVDTPGIFTPNRRLDRAMVAAAWSGTEGADVVALVVDAKAGVRDDLSAILDALASRKDKTKLILVLNKVDICTKEKLLPLIEQLHTRADFSDIYMVSAQTGDGVPELKKAFAALMPEGPWHYPEDQISDASMRLMASEITREKLYLQLYQELPYAAAVENEKWEQHRNGSALIHQIIYVERESQKAIVLGKKGVQIKALGEAARADMETAFGHKVHLFLFVKVKPDWAEDRSLYADLGLDWKV
jgi:GTPase